MHATAIAPSNIAFVKYWGNLDPMLRLPYNASLSMTLDACTTTTRVAFDPDLAADSIVVDGRALDALGTARATAHLDRIRALAGMSLRAQVTSSNTFPMGTGIASSASAYAALTVAAAAAAGLELPERSLSALARRGSGSAARSVPGGFVVWDTGADDATSAAASIAPPDHWDLRDLVAIVSRTHKAVGSSDGHALAPTSPFFAARLQRVQARLEAMARAVLERDLGVLGPLVESEALELHAVALTSQPPLRYWAPATIEVLDAVAAWRGEGLASYATLDAGPNVHVLCEGQDAEAVAARLTALPGVDEVIACRPSRGARQVDRQD